MALTQIEKDLYNKLQGVSDQAIASGFLTEAKNQASQDPFVTSLSKLGDIRTLKDQDYDVGGTGYKIRVGLTPAEKGGNQYKQYELLGAGGESLGSAAWKGGGYNDVLSSLNSLYAQSQGVNPSLLAGGSSSFGSIEAVLADLSGKYGGTAQALERQAPGTGTQLGQEALAGIQQAGNAKYTAGTGGFTPSTPEALAAAGTMTSETAKPEFQTFDPKTGKTVTAQETPAVSQAAGDSQVSVSGEGEALERIANEEALQKKREQLAQAGIPKEDWDEYILPPDEQGNIYFREPLSPSSSPALAGAQGQYIPNEEALQQARVALGKMGIQPSEWGKYITKSPDGKLYYNPPAGADEGAQESITGTKEEQITAEQQYINQVNSLFEKYGVGIPDSNQSPVSAFSETYKQLYTDLGLDTLSSEIKKLTAGIEELDGQLAEEVQDINDNPWLSEALRTKKINSASEKISAKKNALTNRLQLEQSLFNSGQEEARYVAEMGVTISNRNEDLQRDIIFSAMENVQNQKQAEAELEREAFNEVVDYKNEMSANGYVMIPDLKTLQSLKLTEAQIMRRTNPATGKEQIWYNPAELSSVSAGSIGGGGGGGISAGEKTTGNIATGQNVLSLPTLTGKPRNDTQNMALGYANRMKISSQIIDEIGGEFTDLADYISGSSLFPNFLKSDERQSFEQAQRDFINSVLRKESGAAISPSEFDSAQKQYFPKPGDGEAVLAQKSKNRQTAINNFIQSSNTDVELFNNANDISSTTSYEDYLNAIK